MADAYSMLEHIRSGGEKKPKNKGQCILVRFEGDAHPLRAGAVDGFRQELSFQLNIRMNLVGMEGPGILAYYRPAHYTKRIAAYIRDNASESLVNECLVRFRMSWVSIYGRTFESETLKKRRKYLHSHHHPAS